MDTTDISFEFLVFVTNLNNIKKDFNRLEPIDKTYDRILIEVKYIIKQLHEMFLVCNNEIIKELVSDALIDINKINNDLKDFSNFKKYITEDRKDFWIIMRVFLDDIYEIIENIIKETEKQRVYITWKIK